MMHRDWRAGELHFLLIALIVAVAALSSVGFFVDRLRAGLVRDAHQLLAADLLVVADQPLRPEWLLQARQHALRTAQTVVFPSMAMAGEGDAARSILASIKAVAPTYPLRGQLKLVAPLDPDAAIGAADYIADGAPQSGTVWVDPNILSSLQLKVGDMLQLGRRPFRIAAVIAVEPDRGSAFVNFAPRVMLSLDDLATTELVQTGSRVTYRLLLAGASAQIQAYQQWLQQRIDDGNAQGVRIESLASARPEIRATLERAQQFLNLVGLLSALLAALAVALAARRFMLRHLDTCAMLRCFGMTQAQLTWMYLHEFVLLGLIGSGLGVALGFLAHLVLLARLGSLLPMALPALGWAPAVQAVALGLLLLLGFALPPLLQLRNVAPNRVIRRESSAPQALSVVTVVLGAMVFFGLLLWQAGELKLGTLTALGFLVGCALFALIAKACLHSARYLRTLFDSQSWRFAMHGLQRRQGVAIMQIVALALGLMALLLLTLIRGDLIGAWREARPADAPNRFVINIQTDQKPALEQRLRQYQVRQALLYPMIRARLVQINAQPLTNNSYQEERAKRLLNREFNLSSSVTVPSQNTIISGQWFDDTQPEASVEEGLAKMLKLKLGDRLQFDIAGQLLTVTITSIRKLEWASLRVNFFVMINPAALQDMPQSWITAFHLTPAQTGFEHLLTRDFPNLTVVDIDGVLRQIQDIVDQVVAAVEFLFFFMLTSGVLVLYAALVSTQDERLREAGLLRALGATRRELARAQSIEVIFIGSVAGLLAASGAAAIGWALARYVFDFDWRFSPWLWLSAATLGMFCALCGAWVGLRQVLVRPPLQTLRQI